MANAYFHESVSKFARGTKQLLLIGCLALLASCGGDAALQADQAVQTFNKQVIKRDTERHSLLSSLYSTAKVKGGVTPSGKVVTNAELLAQNPAVLKMVGAEKTLAKPQRVQSQALVSSTFSPVFRIQNGDLPGSYFFTIYESERVAALAANPNWSYEGPAFYTSQAEEGGLSPVWRFRNLINGSYVFTIYESERQSIVNDYSTVFAYEGVSWYARQTEALGFTPLYRFRNVTNGTYLFTAYESEKVAILQNYASTFVYEGVAYYVQVPGGTSATPPAMQLTNQSAVLKSSVITGIDASLTKVDQIGNFTSAAGRTWAKDQVFMYQGRAYKVVGVIVNADGTSSLSTNAVSLDQVYDDLSFKFKAHSISYDTNLQPVVAAQVANSQVLGQSFGASNAVNQQGKVSSQALGLNISCIVPKQTTEGTITRTDKEWGYTYEFNNCSLNELLQLNSSYPAMNIHVNGFALVTGEVDYEYALGNNTNYTEISQSSSLELTLSGSLTEVARNSLKNDGICKQKNGVLECEKILPIYKPLTPVFVGPVPIAYEVGLAISFSVDLSGTLTFKKTTTVVTTKGYKEGVYHDESVSSNPSGTRIPQVEFTTNNEVDVFVGGAIDVGVGAEAGDIEAYLLKLEAKLGGYLNLNYKHGPPKCLEASTGARAKIDIKALKIGSIALFNWDNTLDFPWSNATNPLDCSSDGKVHVGYVITGTPRYKLNESASLDILDVYDAGIDLIKTSDGKLRIDLSSTVGIVGKVTQFEVTMVTSATTSNASFDRIEQSAPSSDSKWARAFINLGSSTYGDVIKFKIAAFDPTNRAATEAMRWVEIRIEPAMSAAPKYQHYVSTSGNEGYLANYWYGSSGAVLTANQAQSGYLEVVAGDKFVFSSQINNLDTGKDFVINSIEDRTNLRPKRLALLSKLDRAGSEQFFNFVEITDVVINSVNISPAEPTVGNLATFTITGEGLPANLAVNIPNCSTPVEVRSNGNIYRNNYSTGLRVFTCTPNASGEVVTATFGPNNFAKTFRIPPQTCPAGQTVVNGVCTTTAVTAVTSISPTAAMLNTPTEFTVTGTNLPLTSQLVIATWANCQTPVNRTVNGFKQTCTPAGATGLVYATVMTNSIANGGTVIETTPTVNVTTTPAPSNGLLTDTGITASQCYQAGSNVLVSCTSSAAIALNDMQDGMVGRDVTTPDAANGKLGFSYSFVSGYPLTDCVKDNITGLMWEGKPTTGTRANTLTFTNLGNNAANDASGYVAAVNSGAGLCGYNDWRLPTAKELQTNVDYGVVAANPTIDSTWFQNTVRAIYWSSSPWVGNAALAWVVYYGVGDMGYNGRDYGGGYVRLVRATTVPANYTYSADGSEVTDSSTGLIWRRCAEGMIWNGNTCIGTAAGFTHENALNRAKTVAVSSGKAWRVPNVKELSSLTKLGVAVSPSIDVSAFPATPNTGFWTSSPYVQNPSSAWVVNFNLADVFYQNRSGSYYGTDYVRLVR